MSREIRSDSKISSKRTMTRAATSPLRCVAMRTSSSWYGIAGMQDAQVPCLAARAPGHAGEPETVRQLGRDAPAVDEPVLQARVLVVDRT